MDKYKDAFITGCDRKTEWMLPWFLSNYKKENVIPIVFVDFGVSTSMKDWCHRHFNAVVDLPKEEMNANISWFYKPMALSYERAEKKVWIDTDCEVLGDLSHIFHHLETNKLALVEDLPWSSRRQETWHNTGVVGCISHPSILSEWISNCRKPSQLPANPNLPPPGDQDVLHYTLGPDPLRRRIHITDLPNKYNVVRIQHIDGTVPQNPLVFHWTGAKGKEVIKKKIGK